MAEPFRRAVFTPAACYRDPAAALDWLEHVFGFERVMVITDDDGRIGHAEMGFRGGDYVMIGGEWADFVASPASVGGRNTQRIHVSITEGLDAHCEHARAAGATIVREPQDEFYGARTYLARDLEGHVWTFSQPVHKVSREEAEAASGLKIEGWIED